MVRRLDTKTVRDRLGEILDQARYRGDEFIVERRGRPLAAIIPYEEYEQLQRQRAHAFETLDRIRAANAGVDPEEVERDIARALDEVRAGRRRRGSRE